MKPAPLDPDGLKVKIVSFVSNVGSALTISRDVPITSAVFARATMTNRSKVTVIPKSNCTHVPLFGSVVNGAVTGPCEAVAYSAMPLSNRFTAVKLALNGRAEVVTVGFGR